MIPRGIRALVSLATALSLSGVCSASTLQLYLTDSNTNPPFPDGTDYLELQIWDGSSAAGIQIPTAGGGTYTATSSDVVFEISAASGLTSFEGSNFGVSEFAFNTTLPMSDYSGSNFVLPAGWSVAMGSHADGYGLFDLLPKGGNGANTAASPLIFAITGVAGDSISTYEVLSTKNAGEGPVDFAAHVINIADPNSPGTTSSWFGGTPVPLPAAAWLLLAGLGALGMLRLRPAGLQPL